MNKIIATGLFVVLPLLGFMVFMSGLVYVPPDQCLVLKSNYGDAKAPDKVLAEPGEIGIQKDVLGTGYHWIPPFLYEHYLKDVVYVPPNSIGVVTAKHGKIIKGERFLAEDDEVGIRKRVLGPGIYRMNPYGYTVTVVEQRVVRPGEVGVLVNSQKGGVVKDRILQPGIHYINPNQYEVEVVDIGLKEYTLSSNNPVSITDDLLRGQVPASSVVQDPNMVTGGAVTFPSKDGFTVGIDVTVLWELSPSKAVQAVDTFGKVRDLVDRVIVPKFDSAARNEGSNFTAKEMIQGNTRAQFKSQFTKTLVDYTKDAPLNIVAALPRRVFVPLKIQLPIMQAQLKAEEMLTNKEIEETSKVEAKVEEQKKLVTLEIEQVKADTRVLRADIRANSEKEVGEFKAGTALQIAKIQLEVQKILTQIEDIKSQAHAEVIQFRGKKHAELERQYVKAFGSSEAYTAYTFAKEALPASKLPVKILHAGEGTLWTDVKKVDSIIPMQTMKELMKLNGKN